MAVALLMLFMSLWPLSTNSFGQSPSTSPPASPSAAVADECPTVAIDEAHNGMNGTGAAEYSISPTDCIRIDGTNVKWKIPANAPANTKKPDTVQLITPQGTLSFPWPRDRDTTKFELRDGAQLNGSGPDHLGNGVKGMIGIGLQEIGPDQVVQFTPFWYAGFTIRK